MMGRAPGFWFRPDSLAARLLGPVGERVGRITLRRMATPGGRVPVPVICVGNPTVGGAGKTPTVIALLSRLTARGARPFALLRGHGGTAATPLLVDPARHLVGDVGDEALLLAGHAPTVVAGGDRLAGAELAVTLGASHLVMDDGFQNPSLHKDAALLVVDAEAGIGNGRVLPAGPLRAPLAPQLAQADGFLIMGEGPAGAALEKAGRAAGVAILRGRLVPDEAAMAALADRPLLAFAGIGRPEKFFAMLAGAGRKLAATRAFADHQSYTPRQVEQLVRQAEALGARAVTTQKDAARLGAPAFAAMRGALTVIQVTLATDAAALDQLIATAEARARQRM